MSNQKATAKEVLEIMDDDMAMREINRSQPKNNLVHKNLVGVTEFYYSFEKSCLSHKLFVTLSSVAVSRQKGRLNK